MVDTDIPVSLGMSLVKALLRIPGVDRFAGECSLQAWLPLTNGRTIRIGCTDEDVGSGFLWVDVV